MYEAVMELEQNKFYYLTRQLRRKAFIEMIGWLTGWLADWLPV